MGGVRQFQHRSMGSTRTSPRSSPTAAQRAPPPPSFGAQGCTARAASRVARMRSKGDGSPPCWRWPRMITDVEEPLALLLEEAADKSVV